VAVGTMARSGGGAGRSRVRERSADGEDEHGCVMIKEERRRGALHIERFLDRNYLGSKR
jgi:hypothetical protein